MIKLNVWKICWFEYVEIRSTLTNDFNQECSAWRSFWISPPYNTHYENHFRWHYGGFVTKFCLNLVVYWTQRFYGIVSLILLSIPEVCSENKLKTKFYMKIYECERDVRVMRVVIVCSACYILIIRFIVMKRLRYKLWILWCFKMSFFIYMKISIQKLFEMTFRTLWIHIRIVSIEISVRFVLYKFLREIKSLF